jgi:crotonobetainyl-CoA:carnitine CoA-transferase CaiB-like acyl-CoA transferase
MTSPLKGIRVLEVGQFIAGPYAGMQLADMGASVIKIERPGEGDPFRVFGAGGGAQGYSSNFTAFNRNKLSLTLDLADPRGQAVFRRLAGQADVVLENFRAGVTKRLGIDYHALAGLNPRLVYGSISGFSEDGPFGDQPAYDTIGQARSGILGMFVEKDDPRMRGPTISDQITGMQACNGILAALFERERSGKGAHVEITLLEASMYFMPDSFTAYTQGGVVMGPQTRAAISSAFAFDCADGLLALHPSSTERFWQGMLAALERTDIAADIRFAKRPDRIKNFQALIALLRPVFAARTRGEWMERLAAHDVPSAPVHSIPEAMDDPEVKHLGIFYDYEHPRFGKLTGMHRSIRIDGERETDPLPPPALGEHTERVLRDGGFEQAEIAELRRAGIV